MIISRKGAGRPRSRVLHLMTCALLVTIPVSFADAQDAVANEQENPAARTTDQPARPEIRAFDLETLGALGREIFRHDSLAWIATDMLFTQVTQQQLAAEGGAGWVIDTAGAEPLVRFVREIDARIEAAYDVSFSPGKEPQLSEPENRELSPAQIGAFRAFRSALQALIDRRLPWCGGNPNHVEVPDPDGEGFLVYILRPKPTHDVVPVGGHYRITVSADGRTVEQIDQLFASCLSVSRNQDLPEGSQLMALSMSHVVSPTPLETHVFLSMQEKLPFMMVTRDGQMWEVSDGSIAKRN